jgi:hypothetical protein
MAITTTEPDGIAGICLPSNVKLGPDQMIGYARSTVTEVQRKYGTSVLEMDPAMTALAGLRSAYPCPK